MALALFLERCCFRVTPLSSRFSLVSERSSARGPSMTVPSESVANARIPKSMPIVGPPLTDPFGRSTRTPSATYQRSASRRHVADRIRPRSFTVASLVRILPSRGSTTAFGSTRTESVSRKRSARPFFLNLGNPTRRPAFRLARTVRRLDPDPGTLPGRHTSNSRPTKGSCRAASSRCSRFDATASHLASAPEGRQLLACRARPSAAQAPSSRRSGRRRHGRRVGSAGGSWGPARIETPDTSTWLGYPSA